MTPELEQHMERVARRSNAFFNAKKPGHFLLWTEVPWEKKEIPPFYKFDLDHQLHEFIDYQLENNKILWQAKSGLDDDTIPLMVPWFGISEHSAWTGADVHFQKDTSLPIPFIKSIDDVEAMNLCTENKWFRRMQQGYDYLRSKKDGSFVLGVRGTMAPMDIANAIRGDELFTDFILNPELVHLLMKKLTSLIPQYYSHMLSWADDLLGGHAYFFHHGWMPGNTIAHLSNDAAMLCSPQIFDEFAFEYEKELVAPYKHVLYHVHNQKMHFIPRLIEMPQLSLLEISTDPNTVEPLDDLENIFSLTGSTNLMLHCDSDLLRKRIDELTERNVFLHVWCKDYKDAKEVIAMVRDKSELL